MATSIENKIRALQAKANDASTTPEEAALFADKVAELLFKYNLDGDALKEAEEEITVGEDWIGFRFTVAYGHLAHATAKYYLCLAVRNERLDKFGMKITPSGVVHKTLDGILFIGKEHNRKVAISMFEYFIKTIKRLSKRFSDNQTAQNQFAHGAALRLAHRIIVKLTESKVPQVKSNLPALIINEDKSNLSYLNDNFGETKTVKSRSVANTDARKAGTLAANGISLDTQVGGGISAKRIA